MAPLPDPRQDPLPLLLAGRNLAVVCLALFVLFGTIVLGNVFPLAIASPLWQLRVSLALINAAPIPLAALALLHLAAELDPDDPVLQQRHRVCARLAVGAVVGLLLLLPLQTAAALRQFQQSGNAQTARIQQAELKLAALRQAVANAPDNGQLNRQLQELRGPVLSPADLDQPLARLRSQVGAALDQGEAQIARERIAAPAPGGLVFLPDLLRNSVACLAEAIGFAALAFRPGQPVSLLDEWRDLWFSTRQGRSQRRKRRPLMQEEVEYFENLSRHQPGPVDPLSD
jgi:hypothetical protein